MLIYKSNAATIDAGLNCILSDMTLDAYGDRVGDPAHPTLGWDLTDFTNNPIALWAHDSRSPIGTWTGVHVRDGALRGRLNLAPPGSTKLVDELRALLTAGVIKGISVGFRPIQSAPLGKGGTHFLRQTLCEASLVSVPANPSALLTAKALGISQATQRLIFKESDLSIGQRIRKARRAVRKAKELQEKTKSPAMRASMARSIAIFERQEAELTAGLRPKKTTDRASVIARSRATLARVDQLLHQGPVSAAIRQQEQQQEETLATFTAKAEMRADPPKKKIESSTEQVWRGQKIPGLTWRGRPIE